MKNLNLLIWLMQLGLSVALPLGGFILLAVWLQQRFDWGAWVIVAGLVLGIAGAVDGLRTSLKAMEYMAKDQQEEKPPVSYNDHD